MGVYRAGSAIPRQHSTGENLPVLAGPVTNLVQRGFARHFVPIDLCFGARVFAVHRRGEGVAAGEQATDDQQQAEHIHLSSGTDKPAH